MLILVVVVPAIDALHTDTVRSYLGHQGQQYLHKQQIGPSASRFDLDLSKADLER